MYQTPNRLEGTTYGVTHSRPFSGACVHTKPQNFSRPDFAEPYQGHYFHLFSVHFYIHLKTIERIYNLIANVFTATECSKCRNNPMKSSYADAPFYPPQSSPTPSPPPEIAPMPSFTQQFSDGYRPNMRSPSPPPPVYPPTQRPQTSAMPRQARSPSPQMRTPSPPVDRNGFDQSRSNPYGSIPHVPVKKMAPPQIEDTSFDMGDMPDGDGQNFTNYFGPGRKYGDGMNGNGMGQRSILKKSASSSGPVGSRKEDKLNLSNIEAMLRETEALTQNIRYDMSKY